jgi:hypothetical protein
MGRFSHDRPGDWDILMRVGDRIKLIDRVAISTNKGMNSGQRRHTKVNWVARRGTITHIYRTGAAIKWDDRKTDDHWPVNALALCE